MARARETRPPCPGGELIFFFFFFFFFFFLRGLQPADDDRPGRRWCARTWRTPPRSSRTADAERCSALAVHLGRGQGRPGPQVAKIAARHVTRVVYLSAQPARERPGSFWALPEQAIEDSGVPWTFLRLIGSASNTLLWADEIRSGDVVAALRCCCLFADRRAGHRWRCGAGADGGRPRRVPVPAERPGRANRGRAAGGDRGRLGRDLTWENCTDGRLSRRWPRPGATPGSPRPPSIPGSGS